MERKIVDYCVVYAKDPKDFQARVNDSIASGYHPVGGLSVTEAQDWMWLYQAMVKYEEV